MEEIYYEALDDFPFYDCRDTFSSKSNVGDDPLQDLSGNNSQASLRRRRRSSLSHSCSSSSSLSSFASSSVSFQQRKSFSDVKPRLSRKLIESDGKSGSLENLSPEERNISVPFEDNLGILGSESLKFVPESLVNPEKVKENGAKIENSEVVRETLNLKPDSRHSHDSNSIEKPNSVETHDSKVAKKSDFGETRELNLTEGANTAILTDNIDRSSGGADDQGSGFLLSIASLILKAIGFQLHLLVSFFIFPIRVMYNMYVFIVDPFRVMRMVKVFMIQRVKRVWGMVCENVSPLMYEWLKEHKSAWKVGFKFVWGLLWSVYVCVALIGLLVLAFVVGGLVVRCVVKEPIQIKEMLNFDYTEKSPVAFVPIMGCPTAECGNVENLGKVEVGRTRVLPVNHKMQVTVSLKLPESDYNRNLGIFQVRVDFLAADGKVLASSRRPCMLQFKSTAIRLLLTFIKVAPLVTGYISEAQTLNVNFRGFTEGYTPTACLRVIIEQRAEFEPAAGIPEIYAASLKLESQLPILRRLLYYWKKTLFVWISMTTFAVELLFALLCCKPIIVPRVRLRRTSTNSNPPQPNRPARR